MKRIVQVQTFRSNISFDYLQYINLKLPNTDVNIHKTDIDTIKSDQHESKKLINCE